MNQAVLFQLAQHASKFTVADVDSLVLEKMQQGRAADSGRNTGVFSDTIEYDGINPVLFLIDGVACICLQYVFR